MESFAIPLDLESVVSLGLTVSRGSLCPLNVRIDNLDRLVSRIETAIQAAVINSNAFRLDKMAMLVVAVEDVWTVPNALLFQF